jgi:hypothetical protein
MKHILLLLSLLSCFTSLNAQVDSSKYRGTLDFLFFGRQPSARIEGMGREFTSATGDVTSYFYNPAGIGSLKGVNIIGGYSEPYYSLQDANYTFSGAAVRILDYGVIAFSRDYFSFGEDLSAISQYEYYVPNAGVYRLTLASEFLKGFYGGLNFSLVNADFVNDETQNAVTVDAGVIKAIELRSSKKFSHKVNLGASLFNLTSSTMTFNEAARPEALPVILRMGGSYSFSLNTPWLIEFFRGVDINVHADYRKVLNADYLQSFNTGVEVVLMELLSIRGGYYSEKIDENCANCKNNLSEITYGFGLNLPIKKLMDMETGIDVSIDVTSLKQPNFTTNLPDWDNFELFTLRLNYLF